jgi:Fe-S oxidoreductase
VEFFGDSVEQCREKGLAFAEACRAAKLGYAHPWLDGAAQQAVWQVRKAGLGLLRGVPGDRKSTTLIEDAAVPVKHLPAYRQAIEDLLREHGADACYYAHASVGLLHIRPNLNLRTREGREAFSSIASRAADLVKQYRGSLSGEHGDGRLRAPFIEKVLGSEMLALLRQVKQAFDPEGLFNPGKILDPKPLTADWRVSPEKPPPDLPTVFDWSASYGLVRAVEKCNGAGVCRKLPGSGGMCPSYHATLDELHTTRGRANLLRQLLEQGPDQAWTAPELAEALEWCLSCKACQSECPSSVDLARLKAEALQQRYDREGVPRQALLFADFAGQAARTQWLPGLVSVANAAAGTRALKWLLGVDPRRAIPPFAARTFSAWWKTRPPGPRGGKRVALLVDLFTEYQEPGLGQAAVNVLEAGGFQVEAVGPLDDGRTWLSQGLVRRAKEKLDAALVRLRAYIEAGVPLVGLEPSTTLTFRDEGPDLATDRGLSKNAAQAVRLFDEFLVQEAAAFAGVFRAEKDRTVWVHGHCHQKALASTASTLNALRLVPGWDVKEIASGCCGMAGSFGYKHYELSMRIGELQLFPAVRAAGAADVLCASGTSCRHQIRDGTQRRAWHLAELLAKQI